jgi:hypothetical protein
MIALSFSVNATADPLRVDGNRDVFCGPSAASHFHVLGRDGAAQVRIDTLEVIASSGRIDLREALAWAEDNRSFLMQQWEKLSGEQG